MQQFSGNTLKMLCSWQAIDGRLSVSFTLKILENVCSHGSRQFSYSDDTFAVLQSSDTVLNVLMQFWVISKRKKSGLIIQFSYKLFLLYKLVKTANVYCCTGNTSYLQCLVIAPTIFNTVHNHIQSKDVWTLWSSSISEAKMFFLQLKFVLAHLS